jgi:hypothetical protein
MASFVKIFSGRKRASQVWQYFNYDEGRRKSTCILRTEKGTQCGKLIATKNPTNLKNHLRHHHPKVYDEVTKNERENMASKRRKVDAGKYIVINY